MWLNYTFLRLGLVGTVLSLTIGFLLSRAIYGSEVERSDAQSKDTTKGGHGHTRSRGQRVGWM